MTRTRAWRRYQLEKRKKGVFRWRQHSSACNCPKCRNDKKQIGIYANTPCRCGCGLCGNWRKYEGKTRKEKIADEELKEYQFELQNK